MNMLDMHTREKANKLHIEEMRRDARNRYLLREAKKVDHEIPSRARTRLTLIFVGLIILVGAVFVAFAAL